MSDLAQKLTDQLQGFTDVISMKLLFDDQVGYNFELELESQNKDRLQLFCQDISLLRIAEFGGGLTQLNHLRVFDVGSKHLDRIKLEFSDLNPELMSFSCSKAAITSGVKSED
jgi:hypothetical protein